MKDQIHITPCSVNFNSLQGDSQDKYCELCDKNIPDLSGLSQDELINFISDKQGKVCGMVRSEQVNLQRDVTFILPKRNNKTSVSMLRKMFVFAGAAITFILGTKSKAIAQDESIEPRSLSNTGIGISAQDSSELKLFEVSGTIEVKQDYGRGNVALYIGEQLLTSQVVHSDRNKFHMNFYAKPEKGLLATLVFTGEGCRTQELEIPLDSYKIPGLILKLEHCRNVQKRKKNDPVLLGYLAY